MFPLIIKVTKKVPRAPLTSPFLPKTTHPLETRVLALKIINSCFKETGV